ncbi:unnamed protein product [Lota lota]
MNGPLGPSSVLCSLRITPALTLGRAATVYIILLEEGQAALSETHPTGRGPLTGTAASPRSLGRFFLLTSEKASAASFTTPARRCCLSEIFQEPARSCSERRTEQQRSPGGI